MRKDKEKHRRGSLRGEQNRQAGKVIKQGKYAEQVKKKKKI